MKTRDAYMSLNPWELKMTSPKTESCGSSSSANPLILLSGRQHLLGVLSSLGRLMLGIHMAAFLRKNLIVDLFWLVDDDVTAAVRKAKRDAQ